jgi:hypothetical protein
MEVLDPIRAGFRAKRLQVFKDLSMPFYGRRNKVRRRLRSVALFLVKGVPVLLFPELS